MIDVEVQGFQSIEKVRFRLSGFTVFVGKSNIGKSAIVRALQCAMTGASGTDFVRHGPDCEKRLRGAKKCKCQATVKVTLPGLTFTWEKGDAINQYTVWRDGTTQPEVYSKVDRGTPDFLLPYFAPVRVGKDHDVIQVSEQWSPIFLLNQGGNTVADVLSDVARLDQINVAMGLVAKDRKASLATRKVREKDILDLEQALERYEGLDGAVAQARDVEHRYEAIEGAQDKLQRLVGYLDSVRVLGTAIRSLKAAIEPEGPDAKLLNAANGKHTKLENFYQQASTKSSVIRRLEGVDKVEVPSADDLRAVATRFRSMDGWLDRLRKIKAAVTRLDQLKSLPEPSSAGLEDSHRGVRLLGGFIDRQTKLQEACDGLAKELSALESTEKGIVKSFTELGVCPTCSQSIGADHCLHLGGEG